MNYFDQALSIISNERTHIGAQENRLNHIHNSLEVQHFNVSEAHSRITDADMFREHMRFTRATMRQQASIMILAQSRQMQLTQSLALVNHMEQPSYSVGHPLS